MHHGSGAWEGWVFESREESPQDAPSGSAARGESPSLKNCLSVDWGQTYPLVGESLFPGRVLARVPALPSTQQGRKGPPILEHRGKSPHLPRFCPTPCPISGRDQRFPARLLGKGHPRLRRAGLLRAPAGPLPGRSSLARSRPGARRFHPPGCALDPSPTPVGCLLPRPGALARAPTRFLLGGPPGLLAGGHPLGDGPRRPGCLPPHRSGERMAPPSAWVRPHGLGRSPGRGFLPRRQGQPLPLP